MTKSKLIKRVYGYALLLLSHRGSGDGSGVAIATLDNNRFNCFTIEQWVLIRIFFTPKNMPSPLMVSLV